MVGNGRENASWVGLGSVFDLPRLRAVIVPSDPPDTESLKGKMPSDEPFCPTRDPTVVDEPKPFGLRPRIRSPKDFVNPRAAQTSAVLARTKA